MIRHVTFGYLIHDELLLRYGVHKVFRTPRIMHSPTDGQIRIQYASSSVFNGGRGIKIKFWANHVINCRLDYCNALLAGIADTQVKRLQSESRTLRLG